MGKAAADSPRSLQATRRSCGGFRPGIRVRRSIRLDHQLRFSGEPWNNQGIQGNRAIGGFGGGSRAALAAGGFGGGIGGLGGGIGGQGGGIGGLGGIGGGWRHRRLGGGRRIRWRHRRLAVAASQASHIPQIPGGYLGFSPV